MITELRITDLGVINDAVLALHPGLTVVTGETGAGKTMIVTGIDLLLGGRGDPKAVRTGAGAPWWRVGSPRCPPTPYDGWRTRAACSTTTARTSRVPLLVARQITPSGRTRAFVGGARSGRTDRGAGR